MSDLIRSARASLGVTGRQLADRLGVTVGAVSQMERSEREGRIQLDTLRRALNALGRQLMLDDPPESAYSRFAAERTTEAMQAALDDGDEAYALRLLTQAAQAVRDHGAALTDRELQNRPSRLADRRWETLFRAVYGRALPGGRRPPWAVPERLPRRWYVSQFESLRRRADRSTPPELRELNIFIDERSLTRA
ncbi:helix-turn-helix domain-containing protein [Leifsonia aquatica]|uniref:helix-turn-helix domain-containing protein n=1 Tax=Leifsonia aquatica TaxID=144185 RepID=UPI0028AB2B8F|nr:helix-turn-helix domain-containing protein [Leifsonia aquatica]